MNYKEFGNFLLETEDLDPLYVMLLDVSWDDNTLSRFLLAYWVFYSAGVAAYIAEHPSKDFYKLMRYGNANKWPRGHERRHLRAQQFIDCVNNLESYGSPEKVVAAMTKGCDFQTISINARKFRGFGPWISWKIADMVDRVLGIEVDFSNSEIGVYADPVKGAALIGFGDQKYPITLPEVHDVFAMMQNDFGHYSAPPSYDRDVNIQELETIACKYKSHVNNHYPLGNDTFDIQEGLHGWGDLADELADILRPLADHLSIDKGIQWR